MAYKFQLGEAQLSGALVQEGAIKVHNESGTEVANFSQAGIVSGSGQLQAASVDVDGAVDGKDGFKVNGTAIVDSARAVSNITSVDGSGDLTMGTITMTDFSVDADGDLSAKSLVSTSTISGSAALQGASVSVDGSVTAGTSFVIGSADLNEADMEKLDGITNGTAAASKALVLDASRNITNINNLTASYFKGDGSGITNINVGNLDAVGSDTYVQYNQNGEFGANAGLIYDGSGSLAVSGSSSGMQSGELYFGTAASKQAQLLVEEDDGYLFVMKTEGGIDLSGSTGITAMMPDAQYFNIASEYEDSGLRIIDYADNTQVQLKRDGSVSGSAFGSFLGLAVNNTQVFSSAQQLMNVASLDATTEATIEAAIDTLANLASMGSNGSELEALGSLDVAQTFKIANSQLSDASKNLTAAGVSGSGNFSIGGTLTADNLANATVDLTADMMVIDDGASGAIKITSLASYATALAAGSNEGLSSTAGRLGLDLNDLAGAAVNVAADSIAIVDADDSNGTKKESIADLVSAMAGAGLTATSGQLSTQAQSVHTDFNAGVAIEEGYNVYTGSADINVALPASAGLTAGDLFAVKQGATGDITITANGSDLIDGEGSIVLESPYAAVSVLFTGVANTFRII